MGTNSQPTRKQGVEAVLALLSAQQRRAVTEILGTSAPNEASRAIAARLRDPTTAESVKAALCLVAAALNLRGAGAAVRDAFSDARSSELAWEAAKALTTLRPRRYVSTLQRVLKAAGKPEKAAAAAWALGASVSKRASRTLSRTVQRPAVPTVVRAHACEALGLVGGPSAVPALRHCLRDNAAEVRFWAAYALGTLQAVDALPDLALLAKSDRRRVRQHGTVAQEAQWAIDQINRHANP